MKKRKKVVAFQQARTDLRNMEQFIGTICIILAMGQIFLIGFSVGQRTTENQNKD